MGACGVVALEEASGEVRGLLGEKIHGKKMKGVLAYLIVIVYAQLEMGSWRVLLGKWVASAAN